MAAYTTGTRGPGGATRIRPAGAALDIPEAVACGGLVRSQGVSVQQPGVPEPAGAGVDHERRGRLRAGVSVVGVEAEGCKEGGWRRVTNCCDKCGSRLCPICNENAINARDSKSCAECKTTRREFSAKEENLIRLACSTKYCKGIYVMLAKYLGRTRTSVAAKALKMGLSRRREDAKFPECESCLRRIIADGSLVIRGGSMYTLCRSCAQQLEMAA